MVAYALPANELTRVASGELKFILQSPRSPRARHARVADPLQLRFGRAEARRDLDGVCIARATLHIAKTGVRRVLSESRIGAGTGANEAAGILSRVLQAEDGMPKAEDAREQLAKDLGHDSWAALFADTVKSADGKGELRGGVWVRELVAWRLT